MGLFHSKQKQCEKTNVKKVETINNIIKRYEYIKHTKKMTDVNDILRIVENTNWDEVEMEYEPLPSAPPSVVQIPIAVEIKQIIT